MHPDVFAELHKVRHRSSHIVTPRRDVRAWSRVWIDYSAGRVSDQTEVPGPVIEVFADDPETPGRCFPTLFSRSNRRNESHPAILNQIDRLLGQINDHRSLMGAQ